MKHFAKILALGFSGECHNSPTSLPEFFVNIEHHLPLLGTLRSRLFPYQYLCVASGSSMCRINQNRDGSKREPVKSVEHSGCVFGFLNVLYNCPMKLRSMYMPMLDFPA